MEFLDALSELEKSTQFKLWVKKNKKSYLSYGFIMKDPAVKEEWQIGYYNPTTDTVTTFTIGEDIVQNPEAEMFKDDKKVLPLEVKDIKITLKEALKIAEKIQDEKYSAHKPFKKIIILQKLEIGQVWNITYITNTFKSLNIKIDSVTGNIVIDELVDLFRIEK